jgi:hypothetical protein
MNTDEKLIRTISLKFEHTIDPIFESCEIHEKDSRDILYVLGVVSTTLILAKYIKQKNKLFKK